MTNPPEPGLFDILLPAAIGAILTLIIQYIVQVYVIPRTEKRKRKEARWEERVDLLGEVLTTEFAEAAQEYRVGLGILADLYKEEQAALDEQADVGQIHSLIKTWQGQTSKAREEYNKQLTRVRWLCKRITSTDQYGPETRKMLLLGIEISIADTEIYGLLSGESHDTAAVEEFFKKEQKARSEILKITEKLADEGLKNRRKGIIKPSVKKIKTRISQGRKPSEESTKEIPG